MSHPKMIRREFLKTGGALVIGFSLRDTLGAQNQGAQERGSKPGPPDARQLDTWLAIHPDNTATVYIGFAELGQGASTALLQIAAEELDLEMGQIKTVRLDTNVTPNQGGTYSSASINRGGPQVRTAAAEARQALLKLASARLNAAPDQLSVSKGVVSGGGKSVSYGELIGGELFNVAFTGSASVKQPLQYKVVGTSIPRNDTPAKVSARYQYMQYVRVPGMLHGRVVRPRGQRMYGAGAKIVSVDESSIRSISGARVLRKADFLGVVAENEWDAVRAAQQLRVAWETPPALPGSDKLHEHMRAAKTDDSVVVERGSVSAGMSGAAHIVSQACLGPYQAHAPFGPNCAIADVRADSVLVMCSTQDVYGTRNGLSRLLGMPAEKIRVQYYEGSGTYGHSCYDDVAQAAVLLSQLAGKPVRLQFMRWDEHGWDNYGPAHMGECRAAADANGKIVAYEYHGWDNYGPAHMGECRAAADANGKIIAYEYQGWQHGWSNTETSAQLTGVPTSEWPGGAGMGVQGVNRLACGGMYDIPNLKLVNHKLPVTSYLKGGWLRSPLDLSFTFASEQAIDHLAYLTGTDPYEFRRKNMTDPRWLGVLDAAAKSAKWTPRKAALNVSKSKVVTGRGIGVGTHLTSYGGAVAEIEVNKETGRVVAKHLYGAIDAGQVVNPGFVENQIGGQLVQTASRMFKEEIKLDQTGVTSLDWASYPILRFDECPEVTAVVVQRLDQRSTGAGEEVMAAAAAAIANAFFDATGVRMKQFPFTPDRVRAALKSA